MSRIKVIVATTKPYVMPDDEMYLPLQVGAKDKPSIGYLRDDTGENISEKNPHYCELTGLYWAWKNLDFDALGLVHYRRYLGQWGFGKKNTRIISKEKVEKLLSQADVIVGKPRHYFIETNWSHYAHAHYEEDLQVLKKCMVQHSPDYVPTFEKIMKRRWGHRFNIFIMKKDVLNAYCEWLFSMLERIEKELDISQYSPYQARVYGYLGERLLDVWLEKNEITYLQQPVLYMEYQNWIVKIWRFLKRKYVN